MSSRLRIRKKSTRIETPDISTAPAQGMFQSRPFVVQTQTAEKSQQQPDLKTALMRAQRYGHHLGRMQPAGLKAPTAVQPKLGMRHSVESHRAKAPQMLQAKLAVGAPGDRYEQEADAVAAQVVDRINEGGERSAEQQLAPSLFGQRPNTNKSSNPFGGNIQPLTQQKSAERTQEAKPHLEQAIVVQQSDRTLVGSLSKPIQCANTVVDDATDPQNTVAPGSGRGLLQDSSGTVQPSVQFGPLINDCGTYMHAVIHPADDMGGTIPQPGTWPTWWTANQPFNTNFWVRGHLLNHNIGGPGDDKRNLTPITKKANSAHLKLVETAAKKASRMGWGLDYIVEANYDTVGPTNLVGDNTDPNRAVWPYLTTGFLCKVGYIHMRTGKIFYDQPEFIENKR